jgi:cadmium resistance transport/sequestration family protein
MGWLGQTIITGITSFIATNIDDIVILIIFFAQVPHQANHQLLPNQLTVAQIIVGKYLGFIVLLLASLVGYFGGLFIPNQWLGLLGFVPVAIGISHLLQLLQPDHAEDEIQTVTAELSHIPNSKFAHILNPQTYAIAGITIANGGDNIGIYVPLFANTDLSELSIIIIIFLIMIGVWCAIAYYLTRHPILAHAITHYGKVIVPFVLIALGIYILLDSGAYQLLPILG